MAEPTVTLKLPPLVASPVRLSWGKIEGADPSGPYWQPSLDIGMGIGAKVGEKFQVSILQELSSQFTPWIDDPFAARDTSIYDNFTMASTTVEFRFWSRLFASDKEEFVVAEHPFVKIGFGRVQGHVLLPKPATQFGSDIPKVSRNSDGSTGSSVDVEENVLVLGAGFSPVSSGETRGRSESGLELGVTCFLNERIQYCSVNASLMRFDFLSPREP